MTASAYMEGWKWAVPVLDWSINIINTEKENKMIDTNNEPVVFPDPEEVTFDSLIAAKIAEALVENGMNEASVANFFTDAIDEWAMDNLERKVESVIDNLMPYGASSLDDFIVQSNFDPSDYDLVTDIELSDAISQAKEDMEERIQDLTGGEDISSALESALERITELEEAIGRVTQAINDFAV